MLIYSPTQTERFIRCPRLWDYTRRWEPQGGDKYWLEQLIGTGIHAGLADYYGTAGAGDHERAAHDTLREGWPADTAIETTKDAALAIITRCLKRALGLKLGMGEGESIIAVEQELGEIAPGSTQAPRIDMAYKDARGITVVDWKYAHNLGNWAMQKRMDEVAVSWQLRHYAWRMSLMHPDIPVVQAGVALVVGSPTPAAKWVPFEVTPELILDWYNSAQQIWGDIEACRDGLREPEAHIGSACLQYGGCPFYNGCHVLMGDETRFDTLYKRKEGA